MTAELFWKNFRYVILVVAALAAVVTPIPTPALTVRNMGFLVALYLLGVGAMVFRKRH